jgi:hypothetical protein
MLVYIANTPSLLREHSNGINTTAWFITPDIIRTFVTQPPSVYCFVTQPPSVGCLGVGLIFALAYKRGSKGVSRGTRKLPPFVLGTHTLHVVVTRQIQYQNAISVHTTHT